MDNLTVTLIEDNALNSRLIQKILQDSGIDVNVFNNAEDALNDLNGVMPDAILLDLQLPGMSGYEFARYLKNIKKRPDVPIIAVSANIRPEDQDLAYESGCDGFITKPVDTRNLVNEIMKYLEKE